jgi:hypothetical protein
MSERGAMTLAQVRDLLGCEVVFDPGNLASTRVCLACGADLMSDVLAFIKPDALLLTGLTNAHSVRTAELAEVRAVVYVRNKRPEPGAIALAQEMGLPLLRTALPMYEACGHLYAAGLTGTAPASDARSPEPSHARTPENELHKGV